MQHPSGFQEQEIFTPTAHKNIVDMSRDRDYAGFYVLTSIS